MMRALVFQGPETLAVVERELPRLQEGEVLIRVGYAGICGSDMSIYSGKHPRAKAPLVMGHEFSGTVADSGTAKNIRTGDLVTVNPLIYCGVCDTCLQGFWHVCESLKLIGIDQDGGFAEYVAVPEKNIVLLPSRMSLKTAPLIEPLAVAVHAVRKSALKIGDTVVVLGGGPIGVLTALAAKEAGAGLILLSEPSEGRRKFAAALGFAAYDPSELNEALLREKNEGRLADVVYEAAGVQATSLAATTLVKPTGQVVIVSVFKQPELVHLQQLNFKELTMLGVRVYTNLDFEIAIRLLSLNTVYQQIITDCFLLKEAQKGFDLMGESKTSMKVLLDLSTAEQ